MISRLFIQKTFEPFKSSWGVWAIPLPHEDGFIMPIGWEEELNERGIEFAEIEILEDTNESEDLP